MGKQNVADKINKTLKEFFSTPSNPKKVKAKSLMNLFIEKGIFSSNHSNGLPIRDYLRYLDDNNMLHLIPYVMVERKAIYRYWFFVDISSYKTSSSVNDMYETHIKKNLPFLEVEELIQMNIILLTYVMKYLIKKLQDSISLISL